MPNGDNGHEEDASMKARAAQAYEGIKTSELKLDVPSQSKVNLVNLNNTLGVLSKYEQLFLKKFLDLKFVLQHRTGSWLIIKGKHKGEGEFANRNQRNQEAKLMSLFDLAKMKAMQPQSYKGEEEGDKLKAIAETLKAALDGQDSEQKQMLGALYDLTPVVYENELKKSDFVNDTKLVWIMGDKDVVSFTFEKIAGVPIQDLRVCQIKDFNCILAMLHFPDRMQTMSKDFTHWKNIDFCFFRWYVASPEVGDVPQKERDLQLYGNAQKYFTDTRLHVEGFISFNDWDDYLHEDDHFVSEVKFVQGKDWPAKSITLEIKIPCDQEVSQDEPHKIATKIATEPVDEPKSLKIKLKDEVFFGKDIREGVALSVLRMLRFLDPTEAVIKCWNESEEFDVLVAWLIANIWPSLEAKLPGSMNYYDFKVSKAAAKRDNGMDPSTPKHSPLSSTATSVSQWKGGSS
jgi:hypothetical protein